MSHRYALIGTGSNKLLTMDWIQLQSEENLLWFTILLVLFSHFFPKNPETCFRAR